MSSDYYARRKAAGLCPMCGGKRDRMPLIICTKCADKTYARVNAIKDKQRKEGICTACGKPNNTGKWLCEACSEKRKEAYRDYKEIGLCVVCHKNEAMKNRTLCRACALRRSDIQVARYARKKAERQAKAE